MGVESFFKKLIGQAQKEKPAPYLSAAKKIEELKETLPAIEVENKVLWVNPDFPELPFELKEGEPAKLGLFLTPSGPGFPLEILAKHNRSGILGRVIFKDREGRIYRDVDLKGIGMNEDKKVLELHPDSRKERTLGLLNLADAYKDRESAEDFLKKGIRTHRVVGIISLKEVIDKYGNKISVEEAKKGKPPTPQLVHEKTTPVISVRAYGTKLRVGDFSWDSEHRQTLLDDARLLICKEFGFDPKNFKKKEYINWFIKTLAKQVALMHKNGWFHGYLTSHNITLDARITDLDSVDWLKNFSASDAKGKKAKDLTDAFDVCTFLAYMELETEGELDDVSAKFYEVYQKAIKN